MALSWSPAVDTTDAEERILSRCKKAKLFVFLRRHRHELFDEAFERELIAMYPSRTSGKAPVAPALLATVTILQAWLGVSDEDAVEFAEMDKRWQMVLGVLGQDEALDIEWDDPAQKPQALARLLGQVQRLEAFLRREMNDALATPPLNEQWDTVQQILTQDLEPDPERGGTRIRRGVSQERRISIRDGAMRHGRKSKASRFDGFKRHLGLDLDAGLIVAAAVPPGNRPDGEAADDLFAAVETQGFSVGDCHIDRGYLAAAAIHGRRRAGMRVHCKAFPLRNFGRFTKADFTLDFDAQRITCPAGPLSPSPPAPACASPRPPASRAHCAPRVPLRPGAPSPSTLTSRSSLNSARAGAPSRAVPNSAYGRPSSTASPTSAPAKASGLVTWVSARIFSTYGVTPLFSISSLQQRELVADLVR